MKYNIVRTDVADSKSGISYIRLQITEKISASEASYFFLALRP